MQIQIKIDKRELDGMFSRLLDELKDTTELRRTIGAALLESTQDRMKAGGPAPHTIPGLSGRRHKQPAGGVDTAYKARGRTG